MRMSEDNDQNRLPPKTSDAMPLRADHTWYNSSLMQLLLPLFGFRYLFEAIEDINPGKFFSKIPKVDIKDQSWKHQNTKQFVLSNVIPYGMGALFGGIIAKYSLDTLNDVKTVYAEAVGYELGKKTEDVTLKDIFSESKNQAVAVTREAYSWRTLLRLGTAATFFVPWHKLRGFKDAAPIYGANAKVGVGAIAAYILGEGFLREPSFFDIEQKLISGKINHKDAIARISITPQEVLGLLSSHHKHIEPSYQAPSGASIDGQNEVMLATRITDLLNQTYNNAPHTGDVHFTIGKFNYLIGFGLLDRFPESMAFVDLANKSTDMQDVKQAAAAIKAGQDAKVVFAQFGVDIAQSAAILPTVSSPIPAEKKFTDGVQSTAEKLFAPKSHHDYAAHTASANIAV